MGGGGGSLAKMQFLQFQFGHLLYFVLVVVMVMVVVVVVVVVIGHLLGQQSQHNVVSLFFVVLGMCGWG